MGVRVSVDSMRWEAAGAWQACLRTEGRMSEAIVAAERCAIERGRWCGSRRAGGMNDEARAHVRFPRSFPPRLQPITGGAW
jgi:hypothetical protein